MLSRLKKLLFLNKSVSQTVAKNTFWLSFGELVGRSLRIGIVIYAARSLGPAGWGTFSYVLSVAAIFAIFSELGLGGLLIREGAKDTDSRNAYLSTTFGLKTLLTVISSLAILFGVPFFTRIPLSQSLILLIALLFILDSFRGFGTAIFRAAEKMEYEALVNIITQTIILIVGFSILTRIHSPEALALTYVVGSAIGLIATIYLTKTYLKTLFSGFDRRLLVPIFKALWPFSLSTILGAIMLNTDTILIGLLKGATAVGFYAAAQKPISLLYIVPSLIAGGFFPVLARLANENQERFRTVFENGLKLVFFIALPATTIIFLTSREIITIIYGAEYLPAVNALRILSLTLLTTFPVSLIINAAFAHNRHHQLLIFGFVGTVTNVILNFLLIPIIGISGSALSTLITQLINITIIWVKMKKITPFTFFVKIKKLLLATTVTALTIIIFKLLALPLFIILIAAVLVYITVLIVSGEELFKKVRTILED